MRSWPEHEELYLLPGMVMKTSDDHFVISQMQLARLNSTTGSTYCSAS
jgi:hypothetical protein